MRFRNPDARKWWAIAETIQQTGKVPGDSGLCAAGYEADIDDAYGNVRAFMYPDSTLLYHNGYRTPNTLRVYWACALAFYTESVP